MKKLKKTTKRVHHKTRRSVASSKSRVTIYGVEHEFIIIAGGGFLVIVFAIILFLR